ncbi:MAG: lipocalin-like domain-containing protein [Anaerolineae bacterium]|nr:lipocalin-like domain-containing protein [Anaerolineae bacterium]
MIDQRFIGSWRLLSCELRSADGDVTYPMGEAPIGTIMYNADGQMSVAFMRANRAPFAANDILGGSQAEKAAAAESYISYAGRFDVGAGEVRHHIEVSLFPNWVGQTQVRRYRFEGDRLYLSTPPLLLQGKEQEAYLIWERAGGG